MAILEVSGISKVYFRSGRPAINAVKDVSFEVNEGEIVGFIGPNGAGKSTTLKIITGLAKPTSGHVTIEGHDIVKERRQALENVGAIVESPDMYLEWSGLENLKYMASISKTEAPSGEYSENEVTTARIDELFRLVGLYERRKDRVRTYSLGMKQRLGIAQALIAKPKLLVLDEPNNGLDPAGIVEIRNILLRLAREYKMAVLVSSHQLAEMQLLCDRFLIINKGQLVAAPDKDALSDQSGESVVIISTDDIVGAKDVLKQKFGIDATLKQGGVEFKTHVDTGEITRELILSGISVKGISKKETSLEEIFMRITGREGR
ncbi:MAG TPA: ABC transporter ATP-binding protein [Clostridia bacterium]|nr:ABC transporter ATP-binding protein [Clostridia bacterium]